MKTDLTNIDQNNFLIKESIIANESCFLVCPPHIGAKWDKRNLIFRSSIWNSDGELISAGFPKFFNWGEQPDLAHTPHSTTANGGVDVVEKRDGSCLIVSRYKGVLITRTRGTFCATNLENGYEIQVLIEKYPKAFSFENEPDTVDYSLIFEWETPNNKIVIRHEEPSLVLIGKVYHSDYSLGTQLELDSIAKKIEVPRPNRYHYDTVQQMLDDVELWVGKEGVCVYSNKGQSIRKKKSLWYLAAHRMKSELGSLDRVVDLFFTLEMPDYNSFYTQILELYDYEVAESCIGFISKICDAWKVVADLVKGMELFVERELKSISEFTDYKKRRKQQAELVFSAYGKTNRAKYVFTILDNGELELDSYKKLLYQCFAEIK